MWLFAFQAQRGPSSSSVPQIVLTECVSLPTSPADSPGRGRFSDMEKLSNTPQRDRDSENDITLSYFSHIVKTPSLSLWKQDMATTSQNKRPGMQDLDRNQKELQALLRSSPAVPGTSLPSAEQKAVKLARKIELRIQESFEKEDQTEMDKGEDQKDADQGSVFVPLSHRRTMPETNKPFKGVTQTQGVGQEAVREDIKHSTYRHLDSLEETIRELELSLMEFSTNPNTGISSIPAQPHNPSTGCSTSGILRRSNSTDCPSEPSMKSPGGTQRPPVPPKPSISTDLIKVQLYTHLHIWASSELSVSPCPSYFPFTSGV